MHIRDNDGRTPLDVAERGAKVPRVHGGPGLEYMKDPVLIERMKERLMEGYREALGGMRAGAGDIRRCTWAAYYRGTRARNDGVSGKAGLLSEIHPLAPERDAEADAVREAAEGERARERAREEARQRIRRDEREAKWEEWMREERGQRGARRQKKQEPDRLLKLVDDEDDEL